MKLLEGYAERSGGRMRHALLENPGPLANIALCGRPAYLLSSRYEKYATFVPPNEGPARDQCKQCHAAARAIVRVVALQTLAIAAQRAEAEA